MTASKEVRIISHGNKLLAIFPKSTERDPGTLCRKLRRLEAKAAKIALQLCNGPEFAEGEADRLLDAILAKVNELLGNHRYRDAMKMPASERDAIVPVFINRDPRGYALKISDEWMTANDAKLEKDMGGYGLLAPEIK